MWWGLIAQVRDHIALGKYVAVLIFTLQMLSRLYSRQVESFRQEVNDRKAQFRLDLSCCGEMGVIVFTCQSCHVALLHT